MTGKEDKLMFDNSANGSDGIIPRSFRYIWQAIERRREKFYVKTSFLEIYNEQIYDLLSEKRATLSCRLDSSNVGSKALLRRGLDLRELRGHPGLIRRTRGGDQATANWVT